MPEKVTNSEVIRIQHLEEFARLQGKVNFSTGEDMTKLKIAVAVNKAHIAVIAFISNLFGGCIVWLVSFLLS